ncbi:glycogen debranching N-terminal domain-containing protein [Mycetocola sp. 2940]|uniref:glycogen debranching N-terminal domain-containing protein n=1 Tax=Mycetocola sp. 2940 TaxID=3156452 RepID=UPI0033953A27
MPIPLQPLLHNETVLLRAPIQAWSSPDGRIGRRPIHGIYLADVRLVSALTVTFGDARGEHIATVPRGASRAEFIALLRHLDDTEADPRVRMRQDRRVSIAGASETYVLESTLTTAVTTTVEVSLASDLATMEAVKSGRASAPVSIGVDGNSAAWGAGSVSVTLNAPDSTVDVIGDSLSLHWEVTIPAKGSVSVGWSLDAVDTASVVAGVSTPAPWSVPEVRAADDRLTRWVAQALDDLDALRLTTVKDPSTEFLAAGSPWFFTLFGRDSLWAARFLLPLGTGIAADTLRVLAGLQGTQSVAATAEQPGKIMHELRREALHLGDGVTLPPLYYGTVDATPLWVCLLHDAWRWGMPDDEVRDLLPHVDRALDWMRDFGDADGDGLLEYVDETGHGLANQGWKDSGDSVQWRDGRLAEGPIALCEVQAYAYEAAMHGADLLEHFGVGDPAARRAWAAALRTRFHERFWVSDDHGSYPAIALDAHKQPVDTVTSNIGHLLGTGLLDADQAEEVAARLVSPELNSGFGLRTMSTASVGYWPLSYHGGSVWTHDTAIAIGGLVREGHHREAGELMRGLLAAASAFGYRMPELHSGDPAGAFSRPVPYPAACRPQAWSAAAAVAVLGAALGAEPAGGSLSTHPGAMDGPVAVSGLVFGGGPVAIDEAGVVSAG